MAKANLGRLLAQQAHKLKDLNKSALDVISPARTRFAPSPTGFMHLGSLRTCLYNYLLAKSTKGQFILRIEDTDRKRLVPKAENNILQTLKWAGLEIDEGPYYQSQRKHIYHEYVNKLLESGHAYRCFCSSDRLDKLTASAKKLKPDSSGSYDRKCSHLDSETSFKRALNEPFVIRFKLDSYHSFTDALHGNVHRELQTNMNDIRYDDFVIIKSDGMPTYHFANVVDDMLMCITHVIRGEEWIASTPKHIALYNAFNAKSPTFVHIPLLASEDGRKLSKRSNDEGVLSLSGEPNYYEPEAVVNFLALQGWSPTRSNKSGYSDSDVMLLKDLETKFSLHGLTKGLIKLDFNKLRYLNRAHFDILKQYNLDRVICQCHKAWPHSTLAECERMFTILSSRIHDVNDYIHYMNSIFAKPEYKSRFDEGSPSLNALKEISGQISSFKSVEDFVEYVRTTYGPKGQQYLRYAILDNRSGVPVLEAAKILGMDRVIERVKKAVEIIN